MRELSTFRLLTMLLGHRSGQYWATQVEGLTHKRHDGTGRVKRTFLDVEWIIPTSQYHYSFSHKIDHIRKDN